MHLNALFVRITYVTGENLTNGNIELWSIYWIEKNKMRKKWTIEVVWIKKKAIDAINWLVQY